MIAGEDSGDKLGSAIIDGLRKVTDSPTKFVGIGGNSMISRGLYSIFPMSELSVMGLVEIAFQYKNLKKRLNQTISSILDEKPDVLLTIDAPEFCFRVAKKIKLLNKNIPIVHYVAPSVWAWRPNRAKKISNFVDHILALFPFEPRYFHDVGVRCDFVGHPIVSETLADEESVTELKKVYSLSDEPIILCLPGSRKSEIDRLMPTFGETLKKFSNALPNAKFILPSTPDVYEYSEKYLDCMPKDIIFLTPEKRNCSLVFQDFALFPNMSVKENIFFGKNASKNKSIIDELIEFTRIKNLLERFPHEISGGQQQRVALVRALSINPALLLLDEPLSHLDHELKHQVRNELKNLIKKVGATVLMVTHDTEDAMYMANKVLVLNNGVVDQVDSPASIFNFPLNSYVARLFGKTNILPFKDFPFLDHHFFDKDRNEDVVSIRPHEFKLIDGNSSVEKPQIKGRVVSVDSLGPFLEVSIDTGKFELIVHVDRNQKIETDHDLSFYIEKK